jgi:hypothetical protein
MDVIGHPLTVWYEPLTQNGICRENCPKSVPFGTKTVDFFKHPVQQGFSRSGRYPCPLKLQLGQVPLLRRECQSIPFDVQAVFHLSTWAPTILATNNWLIPAPAAPQASM